MSKSTKSSSTTDTHSVMTPTNPAWVDSGLGGLGKQVNDLQNIDPYSLVSGPNALQTQAAGSAGGLGSWASDPIAKQHSQDMMNGADSEMSWIMNRPAATMNAAYAKDYMGAYQNPWQQQVINGTLANFDQNAGYTRANDALARAGDDTFGGSGGAIQSMLDNSQSARDRAQLEAGLRSQGFNTALQAGEYDASNKMTAAQANLNSINQQIDRSQQAARDLYGFSQARQQMGLAQDANSRSNIATQDAMGQELRNIDQQHNLAPFTTAATEAGIYGSMPLGLLHGQIDDSHSTTNSKTTTSDPMGTIAGLAMGAGSLMTGLGGLGLGFGGAMGGAAGLAASNPISGIANYAYPMMRG